MTARKILVVEPDDDLREAFVEAAEERFEVEAVSSGAAMRSALDRDGHEIVILNMALPADDALALADRATQRGCAVIAVPEMSGQFAEAAARGYYILVRPLTGRRICEAIDRALRRADAERT